MVKNVAALAFSLKIIDLYLNANHFFQKQKNGKGDAAAEETIKCQKKELSAAYQNTNSKINCNQRKQQGLGKGIVSSQRKNQVEGSASYVRIKGYEQVRFLLFAINLYN